MWLMSVICHRWHLKSDIICRCQVWQMTDDGHKSHQYGCLQKRLCKCSNLVEKWNMHGARKHAWRTQAAWANWLDDYVRNESQYAPLQYFPLYIFEISFIKWKWPAARQIWSKLNKTFFGGYFGIYPALGMWPERLLNFFEMQDTLVHIWESVPPQCMWHCGSNQLIIYSEYKLSVWVTYYSWVGGLVAEIKFILSWAVFNLLKVMGVP